MKAATVLKLFVVTLLVVAMAAPPAHGRPDPTTGAQDHAIPVNVVVVPSPTAPPTPAVDATAGGFDWLDAAIGAGTAVGAVALAALAFRHVRSHPGWRLEGRPH